jgi:hypothetical protein
MTWLLALVLELSDAAPPFPPGLLYHWVFEHGVLGGIAVWAGLAPETLLRAAGRALGSLRLASLRAALAVAGVSWGIWVPPVAVGLGLGGFLNELFGVLGLGPAWGAEAPDSPLGPALYFHWIFQHEILAAFALAVAVRPGAVLAALGVDRPLAVPGVSRSPATSYRAPLGPTAAEAGPASR